jgi:hypothetical protein
VGPDCLEIGVDDGAPTTQGFSSPTKDKVTAPTIRATLKGFNAGQGQDRGSGFRQNLKNSHEL